MVAGAGRTRRLCIQVERASNLPATDPDRNVSDPYVVIVLGPHTWQSQLARNTLNPEWHDQVCEFLVTDAEVAEHPELLIYVNDLDTLAVEDALGVARFPLTNWVGATNFKDATVQAYPLMSKYPDVEAVVHLKMCFEGWCSTFTVCVWENQRWAPGVDRWSKDYLVPSIDRQPWTGPESSGSHFNDAVPPVPAHFHSKGSWQFVTSDSDCEGWLYARSFKGPWKKQMLSTHMVRCRAWTNEYCLVTSPAKPDFAPKAHSF
ncbi:hypothetical protein ACHHYP_12553 [Achlya hypogyna]|uniref:C2 domain-containing protein n=1 Tax=Achlya hypogyna TaxID=1202772 RepID=A0A1V9YGT1_ACHHY|nr:hypothetical protein ACHHYP_12553 [Achlya hypogyna]